VFAIDPVQQVHFQSGTKRQPQPHEKGECAGQIGELKAVHQQSAQRQGEDHYPVDVDEAAALSGVHVGAPVVHFLFGAGRQSESGSGVSYFASRIGA
jgi:hypothetical protein